MTLKKCLLIAATASLCLSGCVKNDIEYVEPVSEANETIADEALQGIIPGTLRIKVSSQMAAEIEPVVRAGKIPSDLASAIPGIISVRRTIPQGGEFEARHIAAGLNLWYDITFDPAQPTTKASVNVQSIPGVTVVEQPRKMITQSVSCPFNDPYISNQWHYYNPGTIMGSRAGADINVFDAWKYYTSGSNKVIVAVVDGGVDYLHEDLAANMWINSAEQNGTKNKDDDGNGYVDDIYGYNFISNAPTIIPENHGTHVAGTISAVNNNGIGVCGIAGGNGKGNGVRIMSCQIFQTGTSGGAGSLAPITYAADNGAVICQNSWGYEKSDVIYQSDKEAIDYFNKYAGYDSKGKQTGPMAGGLVVFAAGNDNLSYASPAPYEGCMAVASIAPDYTKSYYSNYGDWVDISAPGGSYKYQSGEVYSTITNNNYGYMQGTSMACPHVSGVAALLVSKFGGQGYTRQNLWDRLLGTATNIDTYNRAYKGKMGSGLVNATAALASSSPYPPKPVTKITGSVFSNTVTLKWAVTSDPDDTKAAGYTVYFSKNDISNLDINNLPDGVGYASFTTGDLAVGDTLAAPVARLDFTSKYYFVVDGYDFSGNHSTLSPQVTFTTQANNPPVLTAYDGTSVSIKQFQTATLRFGVYDPDGHGTIYKLTPDTLDCVSMFAKDTIRVTINGVLGQGGTHKAKLKLSDEFGMADSLEITYVIQNNNDPVKSKEFSNMVFSKGDKSQLTLSDYITDPDGEALSFSVENPYENIVHVNPSKGVLYITALGYGVGTVTVSAVDCMKKTVSSTFKVLVRNDDDPVEVYPNPVISDVYIRTGEDVTNAQVYITGDSGALVYENTSAAISPFEPMKVDLSSVSAGAYTVTVMYGTTSISKKIVKL
jgi:serine protease